MTTTLPELRKRLLARDFDARCVIGGPEIEAELLAMVDAHLAPRKRSELDEILGMGVGSVLGMHRSLLKIYNQRNLPCCMWCGELLDPELDKPPLGMVADSCRFCQELE